MKKIIKGDDLMIFTEEGKSLAFATAHTLTLTGNTVDITSKDHGIWQSQDVVKLSWEVTSENLYTEDFDHLYSHWVNREKVLIYFGEKKENDPEKSVADGDYPNWTGAAGKSGYAVITSLTVNANTGENATYSVTFTGHGALKEVSTIPVTGQDPIKKADGTAKTTKA